VTSPVARQTAVWQRPWDEWKKAGGKLAYKRRCRASRARERCEDEANAWAKNKGFARDAIVFFGPAGVVPATRAVSVEPRGAEFRIHGSRHGVVGRQTIQASGWKSDRSTDDETAFSMEKAVLIAGIEDRRSPFSTRLLSSCNPGAKLSASL